MSVEATGGTESDIGGYRIHTFTSSDAFIVTSPGDIEVLVVGGGGGGSGNYPSGGGGAGGVLYEAIHAVTIQEYSVTVGAGGAARSYPDNGYSGGNSIFDDMTAVGGGGGGAFSHTGQTGSNGGSGGGGGGCSNESILVGGSGTVGQGYDGGSGSRIDYENGGGGGGGVGGLGGDAIQNTRGGLGGVGIEYPQFASVAGNPSGWFASGGAGGSGETTQATASSGGGGNGGYASSVNGVSAVANTGGGGGGCGYVSGTGDGGAGGAGIVIVRYLLILDTTIVADPIVISTSITSDGLAITTPPTPPSPLDPLNPSAWASCRGDGPWSFTPQSNKRGCDTIEPINWTTSQTSSCLDTPCGHWHKEAVVEGSPLGLHQIIIYDCNGCLIPLNMSAPLSWSWGTDCPLFLEGGTGATAIWTVSSGYLILGEDTRTATLVTVAGQPPCYSRIEEDIVVTATDRCGTISRTINYPKTGGSVAGTISYTTQQMLVNESQILSVADGEVGATYYWSLSGGGAISSDEGGDITYQAPSSNANCSDNPTISLISCGDIIDSLTIAVSAYPSDMVSVVRTWSNMDCTEGLHELALCHIWNMEFDCAGNQTNYPYCQAGLSTFGGCSECISTSTTGCSIGGMSMEQALAVGVQDLRAGWQTAGGCCPAQLL